jgi:hypothetical protein
MSQGISNFVMASMDAFGDWFFWTWKVRLPCCWGNDELKVTFISRSPLLSQETLKRHCGLTNLATGMVGFPAIRGTLLECANPWAMFQHLSMAHFHPGKLEHLHPFPRHRRRCIHGFLPASGVLTSLSPFCQLTPILHLLSRSLLLPSLRFLAA